MSKSLKKSKKSKLQEAIRKQKIKRESDILQKVEDFRNAPCGFGYSNMIKRRFKKSY
ncbi:MAG: hypothetical protein ACFFA4_15470 [Promethearchaeota archaeon]